MTKVDSVIADNPGISLDELVATRKINADQKAQAFKKPELVASLARYESQIVEYKKMEESFSQQMLAAEEKIKTSHEQEVAELKAQLSSEHSTNHTGSLKKALLTVSQFLKTAAQRRMQETNDGDSAAFESLLSVVFSGELDAVDAMEKLIEGAEDIVVIGEGAESKTTCKVHMIVPSQNANVLILQMPASRPYRPIPEITILIQQA